MSPQRARRALPLLFLLAFGCGDPQPASPVDASTENPDDAGEAPDASGLPDAGEQDGGAIDAGGCQGAGGYPAVDPAHAYSELETLRDQPLLDALHDRTKDHVYLSYNDARRAIRDTIDNHDGQLECIYTGVTLPAATAFTSGMNVEHTWPKSEMGESLAVGESDMHHLFPSTNDANLRRSSWPFADLDCDARGDCPWSVGGSSSDYAPGSENEWVFEVRPESRGDVARAHFYFSVRYGLPVDAAEEQVLRCWSWSDPPDAEERARNGRVEEVQTRRNPFVDRPDFVERIADF